MRSIGRKTREAEGRCEDFLSSWNILNSPIFAVPDWLTFFCIATALLYDHRLLYDIIMKRALAERAKQSLNAAVTNAKQQHEINNNHRIPQLPPMATSTYTTHSAESSFSSLPNNSKLLQSETQNESSRGSPTGQRRNDEIAAGSESPFNERPWKIPRLEKILKEEETLNNATTNSYSPRIIVNKEAIFSKSSSGGGILNHTSQPPPLKRRFSMEHLPPPQQMASSSEVAKVATTTTSISSKPKRTENDNVAVAEEDTNSAFYLKHQNRALATELKSLQFAVSQLEEEREARRQHCYATLQAVNELQAVWRAMEEETAIAMPPTAAFTPSSMDSSQDPPSTGTGDSVEWTRALQNALVALGQPRAPPFQTNEFQHAPQQPESSSCNNTDRMEQAVINIAARAKVLQEWLGTLLRSKSIPTTSHQQECLSAEQRLHNLQSEMAVVMARCTELEAQVLELAASRQEVVSRERRVRRNIYRMAAEMLSPEQVVNLLEQGGEDEELEAAVHLEKQQMKSEQNDKADAAAIALKQEDISEGKLSTDRVLSAQVDDFRAKICNLEESLASANKSIQDVRFISRVWAWCIGVLLVRSRILTPRPPSPISLISAAKHTTD